jgi:hypothetical protein
MMKPGRNNKLSRYMNFGPFLLVLIIALAVSAGGSFFFFRGKFAFDSSFISDIAARKDKKAVEKSKQDTGRLYEGGRQESDIPDNTVFRQDTQLVAAEDTIRRYIGPYNVRLLDLYMDNEGVIYIDFGEEIKRNFSGGAIDELKLIAGLYTGIKTAVPGCTALKILIQGNEAESIGGHIDISKPIGDEVAGNI